MFRLTRLLIPIALGVYLGIQYDQWQMRTACTNVAGEWTGTLCLGSE